MSSSATAVDPVRDLRLQSVMWMAVTAALLTLNRLHLTGDASLWYLLLVPCAPVLVSSVLVWAPSTSAWMARAVETRAGSSTVRRQHVVLGLQALSILLVAYPIGWGPVLVPCAAYLVSLHISRSGSASWRRAVSWGLAPIVLGQVAVQLDLVHSYIEVPRAHGLAAIGIFLLGSLSASTVQVTRGREAAEDGLQRLARRLDAVIQNSSDVTTVVDRAGVITFQGASVKRVLGYEPSTLLGTYLIDLAHPDDTEDALTAVRLGAEAVEVRLRHANGSWRACETRGANLLDDPLVGGFVLNIRDVTERRGLEEQLRHQAFHDPLTGLANRALFADRLDHALARQQRTAAPVGVIQLDLDDFKVVNDSLGHDAGDELLRHVALRLRSCTRASDTVARLGGDEFAILLEDWEDVRDPEQLTARIQAALVTGMTLDGKHLIVNASMGIAVAEPWVGTSAELMRNADLAMYAAKSRGKGRAVFFEPGMNIQAQREFTLRSQLTAAIASGDQLGLHYQPVVDLVTGATVGFEALLRWQHPLYGEITPSEFVPIAEEAGLIVPIGRWVLAEACQQAAGWNRASDRPVTMSVNLSGRQLESDGILDDVQTALTSSGLSPDLLVVEVTESVLMADLDQACRTLAEIRRLGVRAAIDDFGTGYSSLGYLHGLPVDILKVDRCFIDSLDRHPEQAALAQAVVTIGRTMRLDTIAEGIERPEQADQLRHLECILGQGFLYAKPMPPEAVSAWLDRAGEVPTST